MTSITRETRRGKRERSPAHSQTYSQTHDANTRFKATRVWRDSDGNTYATIRIVTPDGTMLAYDDHFNVGRDSARNQLAHSASQRLKWLGLDPDEDYLRYGLDEFCLTLREQAARALIGTMVAGDPDIGSPESIAGWYIVEDSGTYLVGEPDRGKSWIALLLAVSVDAGVDTLRWSVRRPRKVLFVNLERSEKSIRFRLARVNAALGQPTDRPLLMMNQRGRNLLDIVDAVRQTIAEHGVQVVILDSLGKAGMGNLNADETANRIAETLSSLCPTWLAVAHPRRKKSRKDTENQRPFGSIFFDAAADIIIFVESEKVTSTDAPPGYFAPKATPSAVLVSDRRQHFKWTKANDLPIPAGYFEHALLRFTSKGNNLESVELYRDTPRAEEGLVEKIIAYMRAMGGTGDPTNIGKTIKASRSRVNTVLTKNPGTFRVLPKNGRRQPYELISDDDSEGDDESG